jgi:hypothetical protein
MIDVNKITSTLAKLPDQQLQQYAQMHKNDPYIMALAMSESNRRKEMRSAGQGEMQEQPKVVDQMVAEMAPQQLPEDMGIGQLPAGEMNFAGGGIIAFADGGDVERYSGEFGSFVGAGMGLPEMLNPEFDELGNPRPKRERDAIIERNNSIKSQLTNAQALGSMRENRVQALGSPLPAGVAEAYSQFYQPRRTPEAIPKTGLAVQSSAPQAGPATKTNAASAAGATSDAAPKVDTGRKAPGAGLGAVAAAATPKEDPFSMDAILQAQKSVMGDANYKIGALNNQLVEIRNKAETQLQQRLDDRKKEIAAEGDVYKDRSDRLVERAKGLASQKNENAGLAFLNAGLAIMSTPGGLATALGKGAQVGTAQYAAGIKDLRAAQERLDEANDRISELRMNRKDLNNREIRALEKDRDNAIIEGQKMLFGFAKDVYGMDRKQAENAFTAYMSGQEKKADILSRERVSKAQIAAANRTPAEIQMVERIMKEKNIPFSEALASLTATKRESVSQEKLRGDWLDPAKRLQIAQDYPNVKTFDDYMTVMGAGTGGGAGGFRVVGVR